MPVGEIWIAERDAHWGQCHVQLRAEMTVDVGVLHSAGCEKFLAVLQM